MPTQASWGSGFLRCGHRGWGSQRRLCWKQSIGPGPLQACQGLSGLGRTWLEVWARLPKEAGPAGGVGHCSGGSALFMPLNSGASAPWWPGLPPQTFLAVEPFPPAASVCLLTANSCPLPGSTLQTLLSSTQPSSAPGDTQFRLGCTGLQHGLCI